MQHLQLATVMAEGMCLCMEGFSASPNCSSAMQFQAEQPAPAQEGATCQQYLRSSTNIIGGCGEGGGISTGCNSSPGQLALGDPA